MAFTMPAKDPDEVLDYHLDWAPRLGDDTISTSTAIVESGDVTIDSEGMIGKKQIIWLSGGSEGTVSLITMRIETAAGRTMDETMKVKIKER